MSFPGGAGFADWIAGVTACDPAVRDQAIASAAGPIEESNIDESGLDMRTHALVRLAALVSASERGTAYDEYVTTALDHGVTPGEIVGVLVALHPMVGTARITETAGAVLGAIDRASAMDRAAAGTSAGPRAGQA